jgi:hypothetical protein
MAVEPSVGPEADSATIANLNACTGPKKLYFTFGAWYVKADPWLLLCLPCLPLPPQAQGFVKITKISDA